MVSFWLGPRHGSRKDKFQALPLISQRQEHGLPNEAKFGPRKTGGPLPGYQCLAPRPEITGTKEIATICKQSINQFGEKKHI